MKITGQSDRYIAPGKTDEVEVTMRTGSLPGPFSRKVILSSDDPDKPSTMLECKGTIRAAINAQPARLTFGRLDREAGPQTRKIIIERGDTETLDLKLLSNPIKNMQVDLKEIEPGQRYELTATMSPPWPNESIRGTLNFQTGAKECPQARLSVNMQIEPRILIQPKNLMVMAPLEKDEELRATLRWFGGKQFDVTDVTVDDDLMKVEISKQGGLTSLLVKVPEDYPQVTRRRIITVKTDDDQMPVLEIPVSVRAARPGMQAGMRAGNAAAIRKRQGATNTQDSATRQRQSLRARRLQQGAMRPTTPDRN